jgi:hypothetical protein
LKAPGFNPQTINVFSWFQSLHSIQLAPPTRRLDTSASERQRIEAAGGEVRATAFEEGKPVVGRCTLNQVDQ